MGKYLKDYEFDEILCSDLFRTKQTLKGILSSSKFDKDILMSPLLREKTEGVLDGRPYWEYVKQAKVKKFY